MGPLTIETPIMSVKEARKLWGIGARAHSDEEVAALIRDYEILARQAVRAYLVR
jgi:hypothetical protein